MLHTSVQEQALKGSESVHMAAAKDLNAPSGSYECAMHTKLSKPKTDSPSRQSIAMLDHGHRLGMGHDRRARAKMICTCFQSAAKEACCHTTGM